MSNPTTRRLFVAFAKPDDDRDNTAVDLIYSIDLSCLLIVVSLAYIDSIDSVPIIIRAGTAGLLREVTKILNHGHRMYIDPTFGFVVVASWFLGT